MKTKVKRPKKWRAIFALSCHGGISIQAETKEQAMELFQGFDKNRLFRNTQVREVKFLGIVAKDGNGERDKKWEEK
jgi:hypothetical protein